MTYAVQKHVRPSALDGISDEQIAQHWALYEGYVSNANALLEDLDTTEAGSRQWAELKRRAGFEIDGVVLHEYYFANLASGATLSPGSDLATDLAERWGTTAAWREDFTRTGAIRGVGWAILYHDPAIDRLFNWWVSSHEVNHPAGFHPVLVMDVFEHAWMVDRGASGRDDYIAAFLGNVRWEIVEQRYKDSKHGRYSARF